MAKYLIDWLETKTTSTGKNVKNATLKTENGTLMDKISIWGDFPNWNDLKPGMTIEGEIRANAKGYKSISAITSSPAPTRAPSGAVSAAKITSESVKEAQSRKNDSIAYFNSLNSAIAFVKEFKNEFGVLMVEEAYKHVLNMRDKFLDEWRKYEAGDVTDKSRPF